jgi:type I restriction enzyme S subunit
VIPDLDSSVETRPLIDFCEVVMGQAPEGKTYNLEGRGLELIAGAADFGWETPSPKKWTTVPTKVGKAGDIIVCVRATIGDLNWADRSYCYGRGVAAVRVFDDTDPEFIWYWLDACRSHLLSLGRGATFKQISKEDLSNLPTPLLPLSEQRRIVARIKECMERVEEIGSLTSKVQQDSSYLSRAFRFDLWRECSDRYSLVELGTLVTSAKNGLYKPREHHGSGSILLRMFNINGADFDATRLDRLNVTEKEASDYSILNGDMIVSRVNSRELVGKSTVIAGLAEAAVFEAMLIRLRIDAAKARQDVLAWLMNAPQFLHDLRKRAKHAIGQSSINQQDLLGSRLPLPPLDDQRQLSERYADLGELAVNLRGECSARWQGTDGLREAILRKAFAGEL